MNYMKAVLSTDNFEFKDANTLNKIEQLRATVKKSKFKFDSKFTKIAEMHYYNNVLPIIPKDRDVLRKPVGICKMFVNWKRKNTEGMTNDEVRESFKEQWGWTTQVVDAEHSRNKYKNKTSLWVLFDSKEQAEEARDLFNSLFMTAIEIDCIEEYKKFKENPEKRILSFDMILGPYAYELYEKVDNGEL